MPLSEGTYLKRIQQRTAFRSFPQDHVYDLLRRADGTIDMAVDGSAAAINFDYIVPAGTDYNEFVFSRLNFVIVDGNIRWGQFGGLGAALTNGLLLQVLDDQGAVRQHFATDIHPIRTNEDFGGLSGVDNVIVLAAGDDAIPIRFSVFKSGHKMTLLPNWIVRAVVQDNLAGLSHFDAVIQGILRRRRGAVLPS